jgi:CheY-like chemotaxis protein
MRPQTMHALSVLLVNDNEVSNLIHSEVLKLDGLETRMAENGLAAVKELQRDPPDVVVMDIDMPVMNGIEALRIMRDEHKSGRLPYIGAVVTSGLLDDERRLVLQSLDVQAIHAKPMDIQLFRESVKSVGALARQRRSDST